MMRRRILARLLPALFLAPALLSMTAPARAQPADAGQRLLQEGARIQAEQQRQRDDTMQRRREAEWRREQDMRQRWEQQRRWQDADRRRNDPWNRW